MEITLPNDRDYLPICERCGDRQSTHEIRDMIDEPLATTMCCACIIQHISKHTEHIPNVLDGLEARGNMTKPAVPTDSDTDHRIREFKKRGLSVQEISQITSMSKATIRKALRKCEVKDDT